MGYALGAISIKDYSFLDYLNEKLVDNYAIWIDGTLAATDLTADKKPPDWNFTAAGEDMKTLTHVSDYTILAKNIGLDGGVLSFGVLLPQTERRKDVLKMVGIIGIIVISLFWLILLLMQRFKRELIKPVTQLTEAASNIEKGKEIAHLDDTRSDEFGQMAVAFKRMVDNLKRSEMELKTHRDHLMEMVKERTAELESTHHELVETARKVGMTEVATGVLHNVGNVLNSVGVTTADMKKTIKESRVSYLTNVAKMMEEHSTDLGSFISTDKRGKQLPLFIHELSENMVDENAHLLKSVEKLNGYVQHLTDIVNLQQSYGKVSSLNEPVLLSELVEDALQINVEGLNRHEIKIKRDYTQLPSIMVDRPKMLQIITNLISNAKYALTRNGQTDRTLTLCIKQSNPEKVHIEISDNGIGISENNLTNIFHYGFTTRKDGHGFGLHSAALAAKEMDGSLKAYSDGPGKGASFVLELPFRPETTNNV